ncbi:MAG: alpha/beta fold hydrolase [Burkholderiales bacterium]
MDLLLLPGLLCDTAAWSAVMARLPRAIRARVPAYGDARRLDEMAVRVLADAPPRFSLAGHSMGGRVALEIVRLAPDRVRRLALLDTGHRARPAGEAGENEARHRMALVGLARERGMRAMGREWVRGMVHPARLDDASLMDAILDMIERSTPERYAAQTEALLARPDCGDVLRRVGVPTLVGCGRDDRWSPPDRHREIAALVGGARLALFDDCGHMAPMERPDAVATALTGWLSIASPLDRASNPGVAAHR